MDAGEVVIDDSPTKNGRCIVTAPPRGQHVEVELRDSLVEHVVHHILERVAVERQLGAEDTPNVEDVSAGDFQL